MSRGALRERDVKALLEEEEWWVARAAGSRGVADLVAIKGNFTEGTTEVMLIEVKSTAGGPWERFGPDRRGRMIDVAERLNCKALLAWWPPHGDLQWIGYSEWPGFEYHEDRP